MSTVSPGIFFICYQGPVVIHPPYHYDIGADLPEEDELLDVHEMIDISIFVRTFRRRLVDEAAFLQFWTEHSGRKRACGPGVPLGYSRCSKPFQVRT